MSSLQREPERFDAIVIGANLAGLVTSYVLTSLGYRTATVERAPHVGGVDASFRSERGRWFDFGLHALDDMRSELATRFFTHVLEGKLHRLERRRAIVLRGQLIPYNAEPKDWPDALRELLLHGGERGLVDDIGAAPPTRDRLARCYGAGFADLVFDEILPSYPSDFRHAQLGVAAEKLLVNVYPWFFPRAERERVDSTLSRTYQDAVRAQPREFMLYPDAGYFGAFPEAIAQRCLVQGGELMLGARDLRVDFRPETRRVESVLANGRRLSAPRVYWCGPPAALCTLLGREAPNATPDTFVLGSFEYERPVRCDYSELILGDKDHPMNRVSFPGKLSPGEDNLVQCEFAFPTAAEEWSRKPDEWRDSFARSLVQLGIVDAANRVLSAQIQFVPIFYNVFGAEGRELPPLEFADVLGPESNLRPVLPTYQKVNINTRLPQIVQFLARDLAARR
jgi:protoporphyrinogen oxidase